MTVPETWIGKNRLTRQTSDAGSKSEMNEKTRDRIHIIEVLAKILASIAIPIVLAISGYIIDSTIKEKELGLKYVEVAVGILKSKPNSETNALREWAISIIQRHSSIPLSTEAIKELENVALPKGNYILDAKGNYITDENGNYITNQKSN
jgi:hypothetical protein